MAKKPVMIRVDPDEWEELRDVATADRVSMAEYIRRLLTRSLAQKRAVLASSDPYDREPDEDRLKGI